MSPNEIAPVLMRWIWKSCVLPKHKFFFWLLLQDRLNTRDPLARKNFTVSSVLKEFMRIYLVYFLDVILVEISSGSLTWNGIMIWTYSTCLLMQRDTSWYVSRSHWLWGAGASGTTWIDAFLIIILLVWISIFRTSFPLLIWLGTKLNLPSRKEWPSGWTLYDSFSCNPCKYSLFIKKWKMTQ